MSTAFGIVLFVLVYGAVAYMIYDEVTGRRSRGRSLLARFARHQRGRRRQQLASSSEAARARAVEEAGATR